MILLWNIIKIIIINYTFNKCGQKNLETKKKVTKMRKRDLMTSKMDGLQVGIKTKIKIMKIKKEKRKNRLGLMIIKTKMSK